jgi:hypothetical protein
MEQLSVTSAQGLKHFAFPLIYLVLLALAIALVGGVWVVSAWGRTPSTADTMPINPAIEERWGIRVTKLAVTADGGLVDFRYIVLDPDKALAMLQDAKNMPVLIAEDNGIVVKSAALMAAKHSLQPGRTYFVLYRNTRGALKHGGKATIVLGDLRLERVPVR